MRIFTWILGAMLVACATSTAPLDASAPDASSVTDAGPPGADTGTTSASVFCPMRELAMCVRDWNAGRLTDEGMLYACETAVDQRCMGWAWPAGCAPTTGLTDACLAALNDSARFHTPTADIPECADTTLCAP